MTWMTPNLHRHITFNFFIDLFLQFEYQFKCNAFNSIFKVCLAFSVFSLFKQFDTFDSILAIRAFKYNPNHAIHPFSLISH